MLPVLEWCDIPAGNVTISYRIFQGIVDHVPQYLEEQRTFWVESFRMGKYPITNAQYQLFIEAPNGYSNAVWWDYSLFAQDWHAQNAHPSTPSFPGDDLPRPASWHDAMAFCRWLSSETQLSITLPTEQEWQHAGQGDDGRLYPWGNDFEHGRCNYESRRPRPVTHYPNGVSPYGVFDMVGNVEEWCLTEYYTGTDGDLLTDAMRVCRGGWFMYGALGVCLDQRGGAGPDYERDFVGFRVVCH